MSCVPQTGPGGRRGEGPEHALCLGPAERPSGGEAGETWEYAKSCGRVSRETAEKLLRFKEGFV